MRTMGPQAVRMAEILERFPVERIRGMLKRPDVLAAHLKAAEPDAALTPGSQHAAEMATVDNARLEQAARTWGRLTPEERTRIRTLMERAGYSGQAEHLADDLNTRQPI